MLSDPWHAQDVLFQRAGGFVRPKMQRSKLAFVRARNRSFLSFPSQGAAKHAQLARGARDIAAVLSQHPAPVANCCRLSRPAEIWRH